MFGSQYMQNNKKPSTFFSWRFLY